MATKKPKKESYTDCDGVTHTFLSNQYYDKKMKVIKDLPEGMKYDYEPDEGELVNANCYYTRKSRRKKAKGELKSNNEPMECEDETEEEKPLKVNFIDETFSLSHPCRVFINGCSETGKTSLLFALLSRGFVNVMFDYMVIIYLYNQDLYDKLSAICSNIKLIHVDDFVNFKVEKEFDKLKRNCLVLDDIFMKTRVSEAVTRIYCADSHHLNLSVFSLTQRLYSGAQKNNIQIENATYTIFMYSPNNPHCVEEFANYSFYTKYRKPFIDLMQKYVNTEFKFMIVRGGAKVNNSNRLFVPKDDWDKENAAYRVAKRGLQDIKNLLSNAKFVDKSHTLSADPTLSELAALFEATLTIESEIH